MASQVKINEDHVMDLFRNMKFDLKQNIMSCGLVSSLKNISLTKTAVRLCHHGIREELRQFVFAFPGNGILNLNNIFKIFEEKVLENAACLILPAHCNEMMKEKIKIISTELASYFRNQSLDFLRVEEDREKLFVIWENLCWTQEGKINKLKTAENIIENSNLSMREKYIFSCNNCLKEKIQDLFLKLPSSIITDIFNDDCEGEELSPFPLVRFWTFYFKGNYCRVKIVSECILKWAIKRNEDIAFQYIWETFASETEKERLIDCIGRLYNPIIPNNDCMLFLCTRRRHFELKDLLRFEIRDFVVITLDRISRYYKVVLVPAYVHAFIKTHSVWESLKLLKYRRIINFLDSNAFVEILEKFYLHFANDIRDNFSDICNSILHFYSGTMEGIQPFKYLLKKETFPNKIEALLNYNGMRLCVHMLSESLKNFEQFINDIFDSEEEISQFKTLFHASDEINSIYCSYLLVNNYEFLEEMLTKFFSKDEISRIKGELPYKNSVDILSQICISSDKDDLLTAMDKFIGYCCEENEDKIMKCKSRIFDLITPYCMTLIEKFFRNIEYLIGMSEWELVEKYWKWISFPTKDNISTPAKLLDCIKTILDYDPRNFAEFLKIFIASCFEQHKIDELKKELIMDNKMLLTFVRDIIEISLGNYSKAESLLDWCYSSDKDAIYKFKSKFFIIFGAKIVLKSIEFPNYDTVVFTLFDWCKPSAESAKLFQNIVNNNIEQRKPRDGEFLKISNLERERLNECFEILMDISEEHHVMMERNEDKVNGNSTKRFSEKASGSNNKRIK